MKKQYKNFPFPLPDEPDQLMEREGNINSNDKIYSGRPTIITVICGYFFITWSLSLISFLRALAQTKNIKDISFNFSSFGSLEGLIGILISLLLFVSIFGYWNFRKWGVYLYTAVTVFILVYSILKLNSHGVPLGNISSSIFWGSILPMFIIIVGFMNLNEMR